MADNAGFLYMLPVPIAEGSLDHFVPSVNAPIIESLDLFFVENIRSARRAIRLFCPTKPIDPITFVEIGKHSDNAMISEAFTRMELGVSAGVLSEAGCPGIADPGALVARLAHERKIRVVPLIGPSSLLLALMASGLNGQCFAFSGYLPKDPSELRSALARLERRIVDEKQSQLFIETPYRNEKIVEQILSTCRPQTRLCIAQNITAEDEHIETRTIAQWRKSPLSLAKVPTLFILGS